MPGACPHSHDAGGWGSPKIRMSSWWHHERAPNLSHFFGAAPFTPLPPPPHPRAEDSLIKRRTKCIHPEVPTSIPTQP